MDLSSCLDPDFKPYYIEKVGEYRSGCIPMCGLVGSIVEVYGLFYDGVELNRGGKGAIEKQASLANGAFKNGMLSVYLNIKQ